jgi:hypothetical protein
MSQIDPFDWVLGLGVIGATIGVLEMNEVLRLLILLATFLGIIVKTWEQVKNSNHFLNDLKSLWNKIRKK